MNSDFAPYIEAVEAEVRAVLSASDSTLSNLYSMMLYHLGWLDRQFEPIEADAGKRVRPLLCLLCCEAVGGDWRRAVPAAAALELVHNFSLIHDDIEDQSATRRGRTALWKEWGLAHGVNTGDAMQMLSRLALLRLEGHGYGDRDILRAVAVLSDCGLALTHGQYLDISGENDLTMNEDRYLSMIGYKTASLLSASAMMGALLGGGEAQVERYREFGWNLGMSFQMFDDLLGIWGDPAVTGKPAGDDLLSRKMTLPVIQALGSPSSGPGLRALYQYSTWSAGDLARALQLLDQSGSRDYVLARAQAYHLAASEVLFLAAPAESTTTLFSLLLVDLICRFK